MFCLPLSICSSPWKSFLGPVFPLRCFVCHCALENDLQNQIEDLEENQELDNQEQDFHREENFEHFIG